MLRAFIKTYPDLFPTNDLTHLGLIADSEFGWPIGMPVCRPLGDGIYEVFNVLDGVLLDEEGHLDRLERSLRELGMAMPIGRETAGASWPCYRASACFCSDSTPLTASR